MITTMAHYPSPTTFCEVSYDTDWFTDDRHLTPYRYSLMRNDTDSNSDTVSLTLPSYTYYEYLKSLYDCRSTPTNRGLPTGASHISENPGRATTWHAFGKDNSSELSRQAVRSEPTRIRPTYPFPSLHLIQQGGDSGDEFDEEYAVTDRSKRKLVWVDSLNKWVSEQQDFLQTPLERQCMDPTSHTQFWVAVAYFELNIGHVQSPLRYAALDSFSQDFHQTPSEC